MPLASEIKRSAASDVLSVSESAVNSPRLPDRQNARNQVARVFARLELSPAEEPESILEGLIDLRRDGPLALRIEVLRRRVLGHDQRRSQLLGLCPAAPRQKLPLPPIARLAKVGVIRVGVARQRPRPKRFMTRPISDPIACRGPISCCCAVACRCAIARDRPVTVFVLHTSLANWLLHHLAERDRLVNEQSHRPAQRLKRRRLSLRDLRRVMRLRHATSGCHAQLYPVAEGPEDQFCWTGRPTIQP